MSKSELAIFDLDNTILNGDSDYSMINYLVDINMLDETAKLKNDEFIKDYQQGQLDFNQYTNFALKPYVGKTQDEAALGLDKVVGGMFTSGTRVQTCSDGTSQALLYGWGKNAPPTHMPDDVGFRVGGGAFGALVLEVHYLEKQKSDAVGESE